jgi:hypothetical protein
VDKDSLCRLFTNLPTRCIVFLKDIDTVNTMHSRQCRIVTIKQDTTTSSTKEKLVGKVSLSTLLNVIDSVTLL